MSFSLVAGCSSESKRFSHGRIRPPATAGAAVVVSHRRTGIPEVTRRSSLGSCLAFAALNNSGLRSAFYEWKAALERIVRERTLPDPRFTYRYFIEEVETRVGAQKQGVGVSQVFPWFGKLKLKGDVASQRAEMARQRYEKVKLKLFYRVKSAYYDYYYLNRAIDIVGENLELVRHIEEVVRSRYKTHLAAHQDVIRIQTEFATLEDRLKALRELRQPIVARFNAALGRNHGDVPSPKSIPQQNFTVSDEQVIARAMQMNPELKLLEHKVLKRQKSIELAKKEYFPDVTFGVDYTDVRPSPRVSGPGLTAPFAQRSAVRIAQGMGDMLDAYNIGKSFMPGGRASDAGKDIWMVYMSINIPIWYDKYRAGERLARERREAAIEEKSDRERTLLSDIRMVLFKVRDAGRKIALYSDALIPKETEALKATESAFRAGDASYNDLIDTQRKLLEFQLSLEQSRTEKSKRLAELEMLVGGDISDSKNKSVADIQ